MVTTSHRQAAVQGARSGAVLPETEAVPVGHAAR